MAEAAQRLANYNDILALPENMVGEILYGELHTQPRPAPKHAMASSSLGDELVSPFQKGRGGPGGWWILDEPELHLDAHTIVPDLAGWRKERMPSLPDTAAFELAPDWVCEVLSSSTAQKDRSIKMPLYAQYNVQHIWLIDPSLHTLEAYELHEGHWLLLATYHEQQNVAIAPFEALEWPLGALWGEFPTET